MMKTYKYIALAALAFGFAACTQTDDFAPQGNQKGAPLAIASAGVANLTTRATITTIEETDYLTGGSMGVFVKSDNTDIRYKCDNLKWNYDDSWKPATTTVLYEADGTKQQMGAYYPYMEPVDGKYNVELPETFDGGYENYDFLYADYAALNSNPIAIQMKHLLSKVTVSAVIKESEIGIDDAVESVSLSDVPRTAVWAVPTATLSDYGSADQVTVLYANDTDNDETVDNYVGYALPDAATTLGLRVTMQSGRVLMAKAPISGGMTGGVHYKIGLNVGKDRVSVGSVIVEPWGTGTALENGVANESLPSIDGTEYTSLTDLQKAVKEKLSQEGVTSVTIDGCLTDVAHAAIISTISEVKTEGAVTNGSVLAGSVTYTLHDSFADAVDVWTDGVTLTLLSSNSTEYNQNVTIENKKIVLDLNGYKLSFISTQNKYITIDKSGELSIRDSRDGGEYTAYHIGVQVFDGNLNIEGGTLYNMVAMNQAESTINMTGGTLCGNISNGLSRGVSVFGTFNMSGGTISAEHCVSTSQWGESFVNISGDAVLTATSKLFYFTDSEKATCTITGGTFSHDPSQWVNQDAYTVTENSDGTWSVTAKE